MLLTIVSNAATQAIWKLPPSASNQRWQLSLGLTRHFRPSAAFELWGDETEFEE